MSDSVFHEPIIFVIVLAVMIVTSSCSSSISTPTEIPTPLNHKPSTPDTPLPTTTSLPSQSPESNLLFAVIGDYGTAGDALQSVADMVISWSPDLIITTGDNNYPDGSVKTIDKNIGQYFHQFIAPYQGNYGAGADINRFFPSLGNHDWMTDYASPYLDYFALPGNERYYDFIRGSVHFFALDSDTHEPDGVGRSSLQADWLKETLTASNSPWNVVFTHYPPYSSGYHGSTDWIQWPYGEWGASIVLAGHDHDYEHLVVDGFPYLVIGLSGDLSYNFTSPLPGSVIRHTDDQCAVRSEATDKKLVFDLICVPGRVIDSFTLQKPD